MNYTIFITSLVLLLLTACTPAPVQYGQVQLPLAMPERSAESEPEAGRWPKPRQYDIWAYLPDTNHLDHTPRRDLRVSFHFMNTRDTFYRLYEGESAGKYIYGLLSSANNDLKHNRENLLSPPGVETAVYPVNYKMKLAKKPGTKEPAIYHHYDDELYYFTFRGRHRNIGDRKVVAKYGVDLENVLNIFVMPPHVDSLQQPGFKPNELTGVFMGNCIKLAGFYPERRQPWEHRGNLNHEVGHALGLNHGWLRNDGCDDTRTHANNCWNREQSARCDTMTSNNIMDYSAVQNAWTPCQIGRMHARMSDLQSRQRKWLIPVWCQPYDGKEIVITEDVRWEGARDLRKSIRIKAGGSLLIDARTHLARNSRIIVEPEGTLILGPDAWLHNDCGQEWLGIETGSQGRKLGSVTIDPAARLENIAL